MTQPEYYEELHQLISHTMDRITKGWCSNVNRYLVIILNINIILLNKLPIQTFMMEPKYLLGKSVSPGAF